MNRFFLWRPTPFIIAVLVTFLSLGCFDLYRVTHLVFVPAFVVFPLAILVWAGLTGWHKCAVDRAQSMSILTIRMESETVVYSTALVLDSDKESELREWLDVMPESLKEELRSANRFAQLVEE